MIVAAFSGVGKTYFASKHPEIAVDFVSMPYKYFLDPEKPPPGESGKADLNLEMRPEWPYNYVKAILEQPKDKIILIPSDANVLHLLANEKVPYYLCYPEKKAKRIYKKRFVNRGNSRVFLEIFVGHWDYFMNILNNDTYGKRIVLKPRQFLSDVLDINAVLNRKFTEVTMDDCYWWDTGDDEGFVDSILKFSVEARRWYLKIDIKIRLKRLILGNFDFDEIICLWKRLQIVKKDFGGEKGSLIVREAVREIREEFDEPEWAEGVREKIINKRKELDDDFVRMM